MPRRTLDKFIVAYRCTEKGVAKVQYNSCMRISLHHFEPTCLLVTSQLATSGVYYFLDIYFLFTLITLQ